MAKDNFWLEMSKSVCTGSGSLEQMKELFSIQMKYLDHAIGDVRDVFIGADSVIYYGSKGMLLFKWSCAGKTISGGVMRSVLGV